jgi:diaminopimelate decarboxylase
LQKTKKADVVGPICESGDFLARDRKLEVKEGDCLAVFGAGAYGFSMSSNYNSRRRCAEVLVKDEKVRLIRKRESYKDLVNKEIF